MQFKEKVESGEFAILAEIEPPKGVDTTEMVGNAQSVKGVVDAFIVPEMSNAVMRMSSLGGSLLLNSKGMESVMQVCCRDRNRLALQGDILAACASGVKNIIAVKGEDPGNGDHHQTRAVYDISLDELLNTMQLFQDGKDMAGINLKGTPEIFVGSNITMTTTGNLLDKELEELRSKVDSGTDYFVTPPVFDMQSVNSFLKKVDLSKTHIIPTVLLLKSLGMARYITKVMPHIKIPDSVIKRLQEAPDKARECTKISMDMIETLKSEGFSGVNVSTIGWENKLPEILGVFAD